MEVIAKIIAKGFFIGKTTYLSDSWNALDFIIWMCSILEYHHDRFIIVSFFRPLRFISKNVNLKIIVDALYKSISGIFNVMVIVLTVW